MQLGEFRKGLSEELEYENLKLLSAHEVFVAYAWHWKKHEDNCSTSSESIDTDSSLSDTDFNFDAGFITHTLTFKCMGATKNTTHQEALRAAAALSVRLRQEEENPVDANAIVFDFQKGDNWKRVGYVVQDALTEVILTKKIISVKIAWVKFLLCWRQRFYAGIDIAKQGSWSPQCVRVRSTI